MRWFLFISIGLFGIYTPMASDYDRDVRPFLEKFCIECHGGKKVKGKVDFTKIRTDEDLAATFETWETAIDLMKDGEMPPDAARQPSAADFAIIYEWYQARFVDSVKAHPGYFKPRRLSAREYRHTLQSLFGFDLETAVIEAEQTVVESSLVMKLLPTDPPGKSGFKNDTSGNPLTTVIWDQYSYLADEAIDRLFDVSRRRQLERYAGKIGENGLNADNLGRVVRRFVPRALRRAVPVEQLTQIVERVKSEADLKRELKTVLMSPGFIYRGMLMAGEKDTEMAVDEFELGSRLSYFLWNDMPDDELLRLAKSGQLREQLAEQTDRLLKSPKSHRFAEDFATQWLALDAMNEFSKRQVPLAVALKTQPVDFLHYLVSENRPLMELIDSEITFANPLIVKFYREDRKQISYRKQRGIELEVVPHTRIKLEKTPGRGGLITMPGILAMNRGPVQRGTWMLERILGVHLPEPPPDVGQVEPNRNGEKLSFRQRFEQHRSNPTCAVCHDKIDPLGFALQHYNNEGAYILSASFQTNKKKQKGTDYASGKIDTSGRLPGGETFEDYEGLKQILLTSERESIIRNIVKRTLSYALCRKLEIYDQPTVEAITKRLHEDDGTWRDLILEVVNSLPIQKTVIKGTNS